MFTRPAKHFSIISDPPMAFELNNESLVRGRNRRGQQRLHDEEPPHLHGIHFDFDVFVASQVAQHPPGAHLDSVFVIARLLVLKFLFLFFFVETFCDVRKVIKKKEFVKQL